MSAFPLLPPPPCSCALCLSLQPIFADFPTEFSETLKLPEERISSSISYISSITNNIDINSTTDDDYTSNGGGELRTTLSVVAAVARAGPLAPALNVRAYEGSVPGPTLRVMAGDRLVVNLVNGLEMPEGEPAADGEEEEEEEAGEREGTGERFWEGSVEAWPNVTNLHVHGLHVSPEGIADNIYRYVGVVWCVMPSYSTWSCY